MKFQQEVDAAVARYAADNEDGNLISLLDDRDASDAPLLMCAFREDVANGDGAMEWTRRHAPRADSELLGFLDGLAGRRPRVGLQVRASAACALAADLLSSRKTLTESTVTRAAQHLADATNCWNQATGGDGSLVDEASLSQVAAAVPSLPTDQAQVVGSVLEYIQKLRPAWQLGAVLEMTLWFLGETPPVERSIPRINVLFDRIVGGSLGILSLDLISGRLRGHYPAQPLMSFLTADDDWWQSLDIAYELAKPPGLVRWSLNILGDERDDRYLKGGSAGLAFAVGMRILADPNAPPVDTTWGYTGAIDEAGRVLHVGAYDQKLKVARANGLKVALPADCLEGSCAGNHKDPVARILARPG